MYSFGKCHIIKGGTLVCLFLSWLKGWIQTRNLTNSFLRLTKMYMVFKSKQCQMCQIWHELLSILKSRIYTLHQSSKFKPVFRIQPSLLCASTCTKTPLAASGSVELRIFCNSYIFSFSFLVKIESCQFFNRDMISIFVILKYYLSKECQNKNVLLLSYCSIFYSE